MFVRSTAAAEIRKSLCAFYFDFYNKLLARCLDLLSVLCSAVLLRCRYFFVLPFIFSGILPDCCCFFLHNHWKQKKKYISKESQIWVSMRAIVYVCVCVLQKANMCACLCVCVYVWLSAAAAWARVRERKRERERAHCRQNGTSATLPTKRYDTRVNLLSLLIFQTVLINNYVTRIIAK